MAQPGKPDVKLVQKAVQGNRKAFKELFDRHFQAVYNYALMLAGDPALAEDITQETFIRAHKNLHRLGPPWNFHAWVFRLARNYFIDQIRKERDLYPLEEDVQVISPRPSPEREQISKDAADRVHSTLGRLPVRQGGSDSGVQARRARSGLLLPREATRLYCDPAAQGAGSCQSLLLRQ